LHDELRDPGFRREFERVTAELMIGQEVRRIAKQKRLSVRQLAKRMGTSVSQVQRLMNDANVSIDALARFAAATGKRLSIALK
jgi:transcriptional regulator with XRE-family HTH domain